MRLYDEDRKLKDSEHVNTDMAGRFVDWLIVTYNAVRWRLAAIRGRFFSRFR